ncbi:MAG TPA: hypothetical protein VEC37_03595 [Bacillota bacterium]|nr:hypothetical protein [Bacillota bacterium]
MKKTSLFIILTFCLLLSGCGGSSNKNNDITVTLNNEYAFSQNAYFTLSSNLPYVLIVEGYKENSSDVVFQQHWFGKTGLPLTISISNLNGADYLMYGVCISLSTETVLDESNYINFITSSTNLEEKVIGIASGNGNFRISPKQTSVNIDVLVLSSYLNYNFSSLSPLKNSMHFFKSDKI